MADWIDKVDNFLKFNEYSLLKTKGKISKKDADEKVTQIYEQYKPLQDRKYKSDYDEFIEKSAKILKKNREK